MEDEMDIQSPANPQLKVLDIDNESTENPLMVNGDELNDSTHCDVSVPLYEDLHALPKPDITAKETAVSLSSYLQSVPSFAWHPDKETMNATPTFAAPYLTDNPSGCVTREELIAGVFINVPRSPKLWVGDQLKMRWGYNTFYTTIGESKDRTGPRLTQYVNSGGLADYENGVVEVRYEVVRRSRLVGVSETLTVVIRQGKTRSRSPNRTRSIRRRKLHE